ncbi:MULTISPECIES: hypothetical protein [Sphingobium]|jgi:hypothetical protein|uniref:hypothetical protein n=1 Tax=Sphingobium TaxID=165695 RepID=UPI000E70AEC1|nr:MULTISPECIES: hypothetical protein [Sphingobium]KAA9011971.1 hypothetical protein F4U94_19565 [Sphingobium limneticum]MBU0930741.1 hypothetical protein [Alphaproteobacteria bacterium]
MIATILLAMVQTAPVPSRAWKERNQPDMPVLPPCEPGNGATLVHSIKALPDEVSAELARFFHDGYGMADVGEPFNSTDVVEGTVPQRRFIRAYHSGNYWVIWYEQGGIIHALQTIALHRERRPGQRPAFQMAPGTSFTGDLCIATKAIISGVRGINP